MLELPDFSASAAEIERYNEGLMKRLIGVVHIGGRARFPDRPLEGVLKNDKLPQVIISAYTDIPGVGSVVFDTAPGARALAEQLRAMHHKKVGLLLYTPSFDYDGPDHYFAYASYRRPSEVRDVLLEYGFDCNEKYHCCGCSSYHATFRALEKKKNAGLLPTFFWCCNDEVANWCVLALNKLGFSVPQDISVVGFDGIFASKQDDELTTISLPFYAIGRKAVLQLLDYYENGISNTNRLAYLQTFLILKKHFPMQMRVLQSETEENK
jgi:Transcriptional regulators